MQHILNNNKRCLRFHKKIAAWRLADFFIEVSDNSSGSPAQQCAYDAVMYGPSETRTYECPSPLLGRYVRIRFSSTKNSHLHLQLCEVQVEGILQGTEDYT